MWMICGMISVIFCITGWITAKKKPGMAYWASSCSLAFVALTLLMEYRMVWNWVNEEDWNALSDVVPTMFSILAGYVVIMFLANAVLIGMIKKRR